MDSRLVLWDQLLVPCISAVAPWRCYAEWPTSESSIYRSPSAHQVDDQNHEPDNQEQVDQAYADMQTKTQKPQNHKNNENSPKHIILRVECGRESRHVRVKFLSLASE